TRAQVDQLNARYNVRIVRELDYASNGYLLEVPPGDSGLNAVVLANVYYESGLVLFAHPNFVKQVRWKTTTAYPESVVVSAEPGQAVTDRAGDFLPQQWHLTTAKVTDAWSSVTRGSSGIKVAILDDGVDVLHPELSTKIADQFDFADGVANGSPKSPDDKHGTACAGVATAAGAKAFGSAPGCSLIAIRTPQFLGVDDEAKMFTWAADHGADVISCSWGPADGTGSVDRLPDATRTAIHEVVRPGGRGRGGKGIAIFWAAGNGNESVSNDGYASNPDVIAVAASTSAETKAPY